MSVDECGSTVNIADGEAFAFAVCLRAAGHDELHGNGELRWQRLDQRHGCAIVEQVAR